MPIIYLFIELRRQLYLKWHLRMRRPRRDHHAATGLLVLFCSGIAFLIVFFAYTLINMFSSHLGSWYKLLKSPCWRLIRLSLYRYSLIHTRYLARCVSSSLPPPLLISNHNVLQVTSFKLLGVTINDALKRDDHIAAVTSISGFSRNSSVLAYLKL